MSGQIESGESSRPPGDLAFDVLTRGSEHVLVLGAALNLEQVRCLREAAVGLSRDARSVLVDCAAAEHLDACALQVLLALKVELERAGRSFRLAGETPEVRRYLNLAGLATYFPEILPQP